MSNVVETQTDVALPSVEQSLDLCFTHSAEALAERIKDWREQGKEGAEVVSKIVAFRSVKSAVEQDHPYKADFKAKDVKKIAKEHNAILESKETDFAGRSKYPFKKAFQGEVIRRLLYWLPYCLTQSVRECAVRQHAFGNSTVNVVRYIMSPNCDTPNAFHYLAEQLHYFETPLVEWLTPRLAYLKVGASSFPEKYRELWSKSRAEYLESIREIPLTETPEQVKALSELYARLDAAFEAAETERGKSLIANSMVKVMSGLYTLTCNPVFKAGQITE